MNFRGRHLSTAGAGVCLFAVIATSHAASFTYSYDSLNRLTNAAYSDGSSEGYSHDPSGNRLSRSTSAATIQVDMAAPSIPGNLATNSFTLSQLSIAWNSASDAGGSGLAGYDIFVNGSPVATTTSTNFVLTGLMPNTIYCLSVAAFDRSGNVSALTSPLCLTTPVFQPPMLGALGFTGNQFQFKIAGGTPGPYNVLWSSNLMNWQLLTNLSLPTASNFFDSMATGFQQRFYVLQWNTNAP